MQISIVINPIAGHGRTIKVLPLVKKTLVERGVEFSTYRTKRAGHATKLASELEGKSDLLVAMGGDGTVREVMNGISDPSTPLGIIPAGMGNDLSRTLNIPRSIKDATLTLIGGEATKIDMGMESGKLFSVMGIGFPADVVATFAGLRNGFFTGIMAYLAAVLRTLSSLKTYDMVLWIDGNRREPRTPAVFVMNSRFTGGGIDLIPHADVEDHLLDVAIIKEVGKVELGLALQGVYRGQHVDYPKIEFLRAEKISFRSPLGLVKMIDGELEGSTPVDIEVVPYARSVVVPKS